LKLLDSGFRRNDKKEGFLTFYESIIVDIRDLWPDIFLDRFKSMGVYGVGKIALALDFARLTFLLKNADSLVAVSEKVGV